MVHRSTQQLYEVLQRENNISARRGMVIDISNRKISREEAIEIIKIRAISRCKGETDVFIKENESLLEIFRCTK